MCKRTSCLYHPEDDNAPNECNYMLYTGNRRGCSAGVDCDRYAPRNGLRARVPRVSSYTVKYKDPKVIAFVEQYKKYHNEKGAKKIND